MWYARYKNIDKGGLRAELIITVLYSNDSDDTTYENDYFVLPDGLNDNFPVLVQAQIDILNAKDVKILDNIMLVDQNISVKSSGVVLKMP